MKLKILFRLHFMWICLSWVPIYCAGIVLEQFFQNSLSVDGKYYNAQFEKSVSKPKSSTVDGLSIWALMISTKYPYLLIKILGDRSKSRIYSVLPDWPTDEMMHPTKLSDPNETVFQFRIDNISYSPVFHSKIITRKLNTSLSNIPDNNKNIFQVKRNGELLVQILDERDPKKPTESALKLKKSKKSYFTFLVKSNLCSAKELNSLTWRADKSRTFHDDNKWQSCPVYQKNCPHRDYQCNASSYYSSFYYPATSCYVLPLKLSFTVLYELLEKEKIHQLQGYLQQHNLPYYNPYYTAIGDPLNGQISSTGQCDLEKTFHAFDRFKRVSFSSLFHLNAMWNQYLRNDFPCQPRCLTDPTFLQTEGQIRKSPFVAPPCHACSKGVQYHYNLSNAEESKGVFAYLTLVPKETRLLVINAGSWFTKYFQIEKGTLLFENTLRALLPHLKKLQDFRSNARNIAYGESKGSLDIYFVGLPELLSSGDPSFEWDEFPQRNAIAKKVLLEEAKQQYDLNITFISQEDIFRDRKNAAVFRGPGGDAMSLATPDALHYCAPGVFSLPSFLFEMIWHLHVRNRLIQAGIIEEKVSKSKR
jgi:hypothetical protein